MTTSPTQRSKKLLEDVGCLVAIVEKWNQHAGIRQDLFGFIDLVALSPLGVTIAVQTTTGAHVAERIKKIQASPHFERVALCNWHVVAHGWRKLANGRWECREINVEAA